MMYSNDTKYMLRCLQLAQIGMRDAMPNPCVGAVIVYKDTIIGEGFTSSYGGPHAEVNAINSVKDSELLPESTLYVSLEPCSHHGKTPPCATLIIQKKIQNVVIGIVDPYEKVSGKGIALLRSHGIKVTVGVLEDECKEVHKRFLCMIQKQRPFITLKYATSSDGFIAPLEKSNKRPIWLTNRFSRQLVHQQRSQEQAILVGTQTVLQDNPSLTSRDWKGRNPIRIYVDRHHKIDNTYAITNADSKTICITETFPETPIASVVYECISFDAHFIKNLIAITNKHKIQSMIVEGGAKTLQQFIDSDYWEEAFVYESTILLHSGIPKPTLSQYNYKEEKYILQDILTIYKNNA